MVRNGNNVLICIRYEMAMVRNGYGMKMIDFHYGTKWQVRNDYNSYQAMKFG